MTLNRKIALAVLATCAGTGAFAQSSVTLFGVVDVNARYVKNSELPSNITMNNSGLSSGRFGFRGVEDLGGGLKAGFWLESDVWAAAGSVDTDLSFLSFLELYGTEIAERRMPARRVVEALDVVEHI